MKTASERLAIPIESRLSVVEPKNQKSLLNDNILAKVAKKLFDGAEVVQGTDPHSWLLRENQKKESFHRIEFPMYGLIVPQQKYHLSLDVKPAGRTKLKIEMRDALPNFSPDKHSYVSGFFNLQILNHGDNQTLLDDGWTNLQISNKFTAKSGILTISLIENKRALYSGDGKSGIKVRNLKLTKEP